jgi:hypothetical protein
LGKKIEAVGNRSIQRRLVGVRVPPSEMMQQRFANLLIFVLGCCQLHSQEQAQLEVGAFEPQPSDYQNLPSSLDT